MTTIPPEINNLLVRFVDDRESLNEPELDALLAALRNQPDLLNQLRDQLRIDGAIDQLVSLDRRKFAAQVEQRIADYLRGEEELNQQTLELRRMALERWGHNEAEQPKSRAFLFSWVLALSLLVMAGVGAMYWQMQERLLVAMRVEQVEGRVVIRREKADDEYAQADMPLQPGDRLLLEENARLTLAYPDGTHVRLEGGSIAEVAAKFAQGKRVYLDRGELSASVAPQPSSSPMVFQTPHAEAIVRGTELYLHVRDAETELEVTEGKVELRERKQGDSQLITHGQSGVATPKAKITSRELQWPSSREKLAYLFAGSRRPALVRSAFALTPSTMLAQGEGAEFNPLGHLALNGGWRADASGAHSLASVLSSSTDFTMECVVGCETQHDDIVRPLWALEQGTSLELAVVQRRNQLWLLWKGSRDDLQITPENSWELVDCSADKLQHIALICRGSEWTSYLNGVLARREAKHVLHMPGASERLVLGGSIDDANRRWRGRIAGLALYHGALSEEQIRRAGEAVRTSTN